MTKFINNDRSDLERIQQTRYVPSKEEARLLQLEREIRELRIMLEGLKNKKTD